MKCNHNLPNSPFSSHFCTFWNEIVTHVFCGKKTLAICRITPVIIKNVVQRTYADFNGRFITVISACNELYQSVCTQAFISKEYSVPLSHALLTQTTEALAMQH